MVDPNYKSDEVKEKTDGDKEESSEEEILHVARQRYALAEEAWKPIFEAGLDDLRFLSGEQWRLDDKAAREDEGRPCLVVNKLPQYTRQVVNDQRQNKTAIKLSPYDDDADPETAKIFQGLIRAIEQRSKADMAYGRAFENAVENSFGFFRIRTDYCDAESFDQDAIIDQISDPFLVKFDPFFREVDGSDANWAFVESNYSKDDYCLEHPDSEYAKDDCDWGGMSQDYPQGWLTDKSIRVCEYYRKEFEKKTLVKLSTGDVMEKDDFQEGLVDPKLNMPIVIVAEKTLSVPVIHHCKINPSEILEETIFPGLYIPVIPVLGKELIVDGKRIFESLIRHAKDPQRMLNYWVTCETEAIALAPKAPWLVAEGQIPPEYQEMWRTANSKNHAFLPYKPTDIKGQPVPPPTRNAFEPPVQAITNARAQSTEDLKATTGMYDAGIGAPSQEVSGIAIQRRNNQSQTSNFHFVDNLSKSIAHCGRILVDIIPKIYDTQRAVRIIGDEGQEEIIKLNQIFQHKGEEKFYQFDIGRYDVSVDTGPSYATKRQETSAMLLSLIQSVPQIAAVTGDLLVKSLDVQGADEIAARLKKMLPPGIADDPNQKPMPPELQAQMQQMGQQIQGLTQQLTQAQQIIQTKAIELESKERIEFAKMENNLVLEQVKAQGQAAMLAYKQEMAELESRLRLLGINQPIQSTLEPAGQGAQPPMPPNQNQFTGELSPGQNHMGDQPWQPQ